MGQITVRLYEELNDTVVPARRKRPFTEEVGDGETVATLLRRLGVAPAAVDLCLVDGTAVELDHRLVPGARLTCYPVFERFDIGPTTPLPGRPLRRVRLLADAHLGRLARDLRLLGLDCALAPPEVADDALIARCRAEGRILLTRDTALAERRHLTHRLLVATADPEAQAAEVVVRLQLEARLAPFHRCLECNRRLVRRVATPLRHRLPRAVAAHLHWLRQCPACHRLYWPGSHAERLAQRVTRLLTTSAIPR